MPWSIRSVEQRVLCIVYSFSWIIIQRVYIYHIGSKKGGICEILYLLHSFSPCLFTCSNCLMSIEYVPIDKIYVYHVGNKKWGGCKYLYPLQSPFIVFDIFALYKSMYYYKHSINTKWFFLTTQTFYKFFKYSLINCWYFLCAFVFSQLQIIFHTRNGKI